MYDYLVVGAGLFGAVFAHKAKKKNKKVLVIDKRSHVGGNIYTEEVKGIQVHRYGAHIFHTADREVWEYIQQFAEFNRYTNSPVARYRDELYNMPFNMNTFARMWGAYTPEEAKKIIQKQIDEAGIGEPSNLEEKAISMVGTDIYRKLVDGYTRKQWGKPCSELPTFIIGRLPVRFTYDNNYFNDTYQGIPIGGYTQIVEKLLEGVDVRLNTDFFDNRAEYESCADKIVFTGMIDQYYDYRFGELEYRSLRFETESLECENYQGNAVVNYTEYEVPYTRIIEHKHFEFGCQGSREGSNPNTVITREYPAAWHRGDEPYYPINNGRNDDIYRQYAKLAENDDKVIFGGRLGTYRYLDMHVVIAQALDCAVKALADA